MKKSLVISILSAFMLVGCGGSGTTSSNRDITTTKEREASHTSTNKSYNLWQYMTPANSKTNRYEIYSNNTTQKYSSSYDVKQNRVVEVDDYVSNEKTIYEKGANIIKVKFEKNGKPNGMYELNLYADIGDTITVRNSSCKLSKHYETITIKGKTFSDVLEIRCSNTPGYYQKGVGEIAQIEDNNQKSVRVLSN
jgi:hypothetical protein